MIGETDQNVDDRPIDDVGADVAAAMAELRGDPPVVPSGEAAQSPDRPSQGQAEQTSPVDRGDGRDASGRFATKAEREAEEQKAAAAVTEQPSSEQKPAQGQPAVAAQPATNGPPAFLSIAGKAKWQAVPNDIKADIQRWQGEIAKGEAAAQQFGDLKPYAELATRQGTTISRALDHYLGIEDLIRRDMGAGLSQIVQNSGLTHQQAASLFSDLARRFGGNPGQTNGQTQPAAADPNDPLMELITPFLAPLQTELQTLRTQLSSREQAEQKAQVDSMVAQITKFAADPKNIYYREVEADIGRLFKSGMVALTGNPAADLQTAYDTAIRMHPEISTALQEQRFAERTEAARRQEQEAADKARKASRSISGSRIPGTVVQQVTDKRGPEDDVRADVMAAMRQHATA